MTPGPGQRNVDFSSRLWIYFSTLTLANALGDPSGLLSLPLQFALKDRLGLSPGSLALFEAITFIPVYLGFAFGFLRDRWRPFGWDDRVYLLIGAPVAMGCYLWLASNELAYGRLLGWVFLAMVAYELFDVATDALLTATAQRHFMTGRLSAAVEVTEALPGILAVVAGGWMCAFVVAPAYAVLCQRLKLKHNLRLAVVLSLFPGFLYLVISRPWQAVAVSALVGLPAVFGHIALFDLLRRACPRELEGTAITLLYSALALAVGAGDIAGAWLYQHGGFAVCLIADAAANALILPMLAVLPAELVSWRDGENRLTGVT